MVEHSMLYRKIQDVWRANPKAVVGVAVAACSVMAGLILWKSHPARAKAPEAHEPAPIAENASGSTATKTAPAPPTVHAGSVKRYADLPSRQKSLAARHTALRKTAPPRPEPAVAPSERPVPV